ncbi:MAG: rRNA maturation RNase YbeY [Pirellulaceae bacterium]
MPESDTPSPAPTSPQPEDAEPLSSVPARPSPATLEIDWADRQANHAIDPVRFIEAARSVLEQAGIRRGSLSLVVVNDDEMHRLNRLHLEHDYPTDVLSFLLDNPADDEIEGEVIVSADTAARESAEYGWRLDDELLLYVVHGCLHLVGHDDHEDEDRAAMRQAEARVLAHFGLQPRWLDGEEREGKEA